MNTKTIALLETGAGPLTTRVAVGLQKIGLAMKKRAWQNRGGKGLAPLQAQILAFLRMRPDGSATVSMVASELAVTAPTASEAVETLHQKRLVLKTRLASDRRVVKLRLSVSGMRKAHASVGWPDFLATAADQLSPTEQVTLLRAIVKLIKAMQTRGDISVARMCVTCRFFRPNVYENVERPHHCEFVNAPFGDRSLRLDCPEHQPASPAQATQAWTVFTTPRS